MFCKNCGKQLPDIAKFCDGCGESQILNNKSDVPKDSPIPKMPPPPPRRTIQNEVKSTPIESIKPQKPTQTTPPTMENYNSQGANINNFNDEPMSVFGYLGFIIISLIPIIGQLMILIWSFSGKINKNKRNLAKAYLILMIISVMVYFLFGTVLIKELYRLT